MDLTLNEALADEDVLELGKAEDGPDKAKIANFVEKLKTKVQDNADKGETGNKIVLWAFNFSCFRGARVLPRKL